MKIGIFGGSFNPPHKVHKKIALDLIEKGYVDKVIYVPTGDNYIKKDLINFYDRLQMVKLIIKNNNNLEVSDIGNNNNYKYTYQTLDYFNNNKDEIYFICGTDNLNEFDTWINYKYILENYKLLVIRRNNDDIAKILEKYKEYKDNIIITSINQEKISSTIIRNMLKNNENVVEYIEKSVKKYIEKNNLYGEKNEEVSKKI